MAYKDGDILFGINTNVVFAYRNDIDEPTVSRYPKDYRLANKIEVEMYREKFDDSDTRFIQLSGRTFYLDAAQMEKYRRWEKSLPKLDNGHFGAIGGGTSFIFTPTGLGDIVEVVRRDNPDAHKIDLTDFENW